MTNPLTDLRVFSLVRKDSKDNARNTITCKYSASGLSVLAWQNYADKPIARATGGGYDKTHTALVNAIKAIYDIDLFPVSGAEGFGVVQKACAKHDLVLTQQH